MSATLPASAALAASPRDDARRTRQVRHFTRNIGLIALSFALDGAFLFAFALAGAVDWQAGAFYTAAGLLQCAAFALLVRSGWTSRLRDPNMTFWQSACAVATMLASMARWPEIAAVFLLVLFVVFVSGAMRVPVRQALLAWCAVSVAVGVLLTTTPVRVHVPDANLAQRLIAWAFFALTLGRCVMLGAFNAKMRLLVRQRGDELAGLTAEVERLARHDELTGLLNRRSLLEILRHEQLRADRTGAPLSVALLDLDFFKAVNDTLGHAAGDKTLKLFAGAIQPHVRGTDRFGRYGGEEFLLIFPGTPAEFGQPSTERLRTALMHWDWSEVAPDFRVTFSAGIAAYRAGESSDELLDRADAALYRAKAAGRNCSRLG